MFKHTLSIMSKAVLLCLVATQTPNASPVLLEPNSTAEGELNFSQQASGSVKAGEFEKIVICDVKTKLNSYKISTWSSCKNKTQGNNIQIKISGEFSPDGSVKRLNVSSPNYLYTMSGRFEKSEGSKQNKGSRANWVLRLTLSNPEYESRLAKLGTTDSDNSKNSDVSSHKASSFKQKKEMTGSPPNSTDQSFKRTMCESSKASSKVQASFMQSLSENDLTKFLEAGQDCSVF